jgi:hypothetical protein
MEVLGHKDEGVELIGLIVPVAQQRRNKQFRSLRVQKQGPALPGSGGYKVAPSWATMSFGNHRTPPAAKAAPYFRVLAARLKPCPDGYSP